MVLIPAATQKRTEKWGIHSFSGLHFLVCSLQVTKIDRKCAFVRRNRDEIVGDKSPEVMRSVLVRLLNEGMKG